MVDDNLDFSSSSLFDSCRATPSSDASGHIEINGHIENDSEMSFIRHMMPSPVNSHIVLGRPSPLKKGNEYISTISFSPNCNRIASGSNDGVIRVWDAGTSHSWDLLGHTSGIRDLVFSADGQRIVSGSYDRTIRVWDADHLTASWELLGNSGPVWPVAIAISPDDKKVSGSHGDTIRIWDVGTGVSQKFAETTGQISCIAFSPDSRCIMTGSLDETCHIWDVSTGTSQTLTGHTSSVRCIAWCPNGDHVVSGSSDGCIRLWDVKRGASQTLHGHKDWVSSIDFSSNGQYIASGSFDQTIRIWDAKTGANVFGPFTGHSNEVVCVRFCRDGRSVLSADRDGIVIEWKL